MSVESVIADTQGWRKQLEAKVGPISDAAAHAWDEAGQEAVEALMDAIELNPDKTLAQIVATNVDLQDAMSVPFAEAAQSTAEQVTSAWVTGEKLGNAHAAKELKGVGLPATKGTAPDKSLEVLLGDLDKNAGVGAQKLQAAMGGDRAGIDAALQKVRTDMSRRAKYTAQAAGYMAYTGAQEDAFKKAQAQAPKGVKIRKMWVTRFGPGTCPQCAALHGTIVDVGTAFPWKATLHPSWKPQKPYMGFLGGPPRHPNCRCVIVPFPALLAHEKTQGSDPKMAEAAQKWWKGAAKALGAVR